jgi:hypothetical protein
MIERIQVSEMVSLAKITKEETITYRLLHGDRVEEDPYPQVGWGVSLFEELSKIREVCKMRNYIGNQCWQAIGFKYVCFGTVIDQKMEKGWLMLYISWNNQTTHTWEKVTNLGFEDPKRSQ